jgi:hypothetical protein
VVTSPASGFTEKLATKSLIFFPLPGRATFGGEFEKKCRDLTEKFHSKLVTEVIEISLGRLR